VAMTKIGTVEIPRKKKIIRKKFFSDAFIQTLPKDNMLAIQAVCSEFKKILNAPITDGVDQILNGYALLEALNKARNLQLKLIEQLPSTDADAVNLIIKFVTELQDTIKVEVRLLQAKEKYLQLLNSGFYYEFSKGDIELIKQSIKELREKIQLSKEIDDDHKARILKRLNDLDSEINLKMTNLDKAYALIIEAQILVHKLGEVSQPYITLIRRIVNIAWRAEARAEGLSSDSHLTLPEGSNFDKCEHEK